MKFLQKCSFFIGLFLIVGFQNLKAQEVLQLEVNELHDVIEKEAKENQLLVVNFWATWCKPCVAEMPYFEEAAAHFKDKGVKIIFVSLDLKGQYEKRLLPFLEQKNFKNEVYHLLSPKGYEWINEISPQWSGAIPATLMLNQTKEKRQFYEQEFSADELKKAIEENL